MEITNIRDANGNSKMKKPEATGYWNPRLSQWITETPLTNSITGEEERPSQDEMETREDSFEYKVEYSGSTYGCQYVWARNPEEADDIARDIDNPDMEIDWESVEINDIEEI